PTRDIGMLRAFLDCFGDTAMAKEAKVILASLEWPPIRFSSDRTEIERFVAEFDGTAEAQQARGRLEKLAQDELSKELANWNFVKDSTIEQELRAHLARYPYTTTQHRARARLNEVVWAGLGETPQIPALKAFLAEFPDGAHAAQARATLEDLAWSRLG